uniref:Uncharacterized protein n=1 Tax=Avena sativa TaxID=4498 RepID=A0ACD5YAW5_AVESA
MKANYKAVQQARKLSGIGWDDSLSMIIAEPEIWEKIKKDYPRVRKFEAKPFLLFPKLTSLYEGSISTGDLNFLSIPQVDITSGVVSPTESSANQYGNPFSTAHDGGQSSTNLHGQGRHDVEPATSASSEQKGEEPVRKRKQSQIAVVLEDYVDFRKKQNQQFVEEMKEPKQADQFSIANCVAALEPMGDLTVAQKSKALWLFKCQLN